MKTFDVEVRVSRTHRFANVEATSPEAAESIAEAYLRDGEEGMVLTQEIDSTDVTLTEND